MNKPWIVRQRLNDRCCRVVARFSNESDAAGYRDTISRQLQRNTYEVAYDPSNQAIGSLIQIVIVTVAFFPLLGCTRSEMQSLGRSLSISSQPATASKDPALPPVGTADYGREGTITADEARVLKALNFEQGQSYNAIKSRLGLPAKRDWTNGTDYYRIEGSSGWVAIQYDSNGRAFNYDATRGN
ncbi:hypothetical protein H6F43_03530 [Leptolyngbya sp. FACHB-36]|uniref:hypothetical protein n=1 Tax=Leptolyngbya sp. FACHB-36 TaxID=2692808 RepID=UPI00168171BD|nr:hypothetical protein [Leptolyngbya sp. FACHB-36]MBD2019253.1 hypothetical protein [Leptolyngbya sp. FACHB-36]